MGRIQTRKQILNSALVATLASFAFTSLANAGDGNLLKVCGPVKGNYVGVYKMVPPKGYSPAPAKCQQLKTRSAGSLATADKDDSGNWYSRIGDFAIISANSIGDSAQGNYAYSFAEYDTLKSCIESCPSALSVREMRQVETNRSAASTAAGGSKGETETAQTHKGTGDQGSGNQGATTLVNVNDPDVKKLIDSSAKKSGVAITKDGQVKAETDEDGNLYLVKGGKKIDPSTGKEILPKTDQYVVDGKEYKNRDAFKAALGNGSGQVKYADGRTAYYENGKPVKTVDKDGNVIASVKTAKAKNGGKEKSVDDCSISESIDPNYTCSGTNRIAKYSKMGNEIMQTAGAAAVNVIGNVSAQKGQNGSQSANQKSIAKMAKTSFTYETVLGLANVATAAKLGQKSVQHKRNAKSLQDRGSGFAGDAGDPDGARYEEARREQMAAHKTAEEGAFAATMYGVKNITSAMTAKKLQKDAEKAAKLYQQIENPKNNSIAWNAGDAVMVGSGYVSEGAATAGTETSNTQDGNGGSSETPMNTLGPGSDMGVDQAAEGPPAGGFKTAAGGGASGGGGGGAPGAGGGGSGGGGAAPAEEGKAGYASDFGTKERYETGGAGAGGRGGSGAAGGKDEGGVDLNGLLAQFLPKTDEEMVNKNGILDFAGGGRAPAAAEEAASYLDKNADLFQRIHETMSEKNRKGQVGI